MNIDVKDFMTEEAKKLLNEAKSKIWECIALKALVRALEQDRGKIDENDVQETLKDFSGKIFARVKDQMKMRRKRKREGLCEGNSFRCSSR